MTTFEINDIDFRELLPSVKIDEFIQKPITMNYLANLVKSILTMV
jgi:hypothetical protein